MTETAQGVWPIVQIRPFLDYLVIECGLAANTIAAYGRDLGRFAEYCRNEGLRRPEELTAVFVQDYARDLHQAHLAGASVARHLVSVKMFMRFHVLMGLLEKDVCAMLEAPKTWQRLPNVLSQQQTAELITAVDADEPLYMRDRALLELLYATGIRASEAAGLQISDINLQVGYLRCLGKGHKERIIPVHQLALDLVRQYLEELRPELVGQRDCRALFVSRTGRPLNRIEVWRVVGRAARRAGMAGKVSPHTLRHCFGSHLLAGGAGLRSVQEMLGHADVATTQIYTHVDQEHLRGVHKKYHPRP